MLHFNRYLTPVKFFFITFFVFNLSTIVPINSSIALNNSADKDSGHTDRINVIKWSPDGNFIASAGGIDKRSYLVREQGYGEENDYKIGIWDAQEGKLVSFSHGNDASKIHTDAVNYLHWFDNSQLVSTSMDNTIRLWEKNKKNSSWSFKKEIYTSKSRITCIGWSPDNCYFALGNEDKEVFVCLNELFMLRLIEGYYWKSFSFDRNSLKEKAALTKDSQNLLPLLPTDIKKQIMLFYGSKEILFHDDDVLGDSDPEVISWSSNGEYLAFSNCSLDSKVHIWNKKKSGIATYYFGQRHISCLTWKKKSSLLISTSWCCELRVTNPATGEKHIKREMKHPSPKNSRKLDTASVSYNDTYIASGDHLGMVCVWDASEGTLIHSLENEEKVEEVAWAPGNYLLACRRGKEVWVWDGKNGTRKYVLKHIDSINSMEWSPDGNCIATASDDHTLRIWDSETGKLQSICGKEYKYEKIENDDSSYDSSSSR